MIALVLAALSVVSANSSPARTAKAHSSTSATTSYQRSKKRLHATAGRSVHQPARQSRSTKAATRKTTAAKARPAPSCRRSRTRRTKQRKIRGAAPAKKSASLSRIWTPMPPPLRGSLSSLVRQNDKTEADNLERIEDDADLADRIARGMLVPVPSSAKLTLNQNLPADRRYCRPWTASFLTDLSRAHAAAFHSPLEVTSAVRTVEYQKRLMKTNGNATAAEGDIVSPHVTGSTIDLAKQGLSRQQLGWLRRWLLPLEMAGKIDVEEEFQQACFHITVYKSYMPASPLPAKAVEAKPTKGGVRQAAPAPTLPDAPPPIP